MKSSETEFPQKVADFGDSVPAEGDALPKTIAFYCAKIAVAACGNADFARKILLTPKMIQIGDYLFWGAMTTIVSFASYGFATRALGMNVPAGTVFSWICAVIFAFVTNKFWVFNSKNLSAGTLFREFVSFVASRLTSGFMELAIMWIFVDFIGFNDWLVKIAASVLVVIANYIFSLIFVFKTKEKAHEK